MSLGDSSSGSPDSRWKCSVGRVSTAVVTPTGTIERWVPGERWSWNNCLWTNEGLPLVESVSRCKGSEGTSFPVDTVCQDGLLYFGLYKIPGDSFKTKGLKTTGKKELQSKVKKIRPCVYTPTFTSSGKIGTPGFGVRFLPLRPLSFSDTETTEGIRCRGRTRTGWDL